MTWLSRIGLGRKQKTATKAADRSSLSRLRASVTLKVLMLTAFLGGVIALFPRYNLTKLTFAVGEIWRNDDVNAPYTFALLKTAEEIRTERDEIQRVNPPIFHVDDRARIRILTRLDSLYRSVNTLQQEYIKWKRSDGPTRQVDSAAFYDRITAEKPLGLDRNAWRPLLLSYLDSRQQTGRPGRVATVEIRIAIETVVGELFADGVINRAKTDVLNEDITVRDLNQRTEKSLFVAKVRDPEEARQHASFRLTRLLTADENNAAAVWFQAVFEPNLIYSERETRQRESEAMATLSRTKGAVPFGTSIIRKGEVITPEKQNMLFSLEKAKAERATEFEKWQQFLGDIVVLLAVMAVFFMYLFLYRRPIFDDNVHLALVIICLSVICAAGAFTAGFSNYGEWVVPVTVAPVVLTIIFDSRVGIFSSLTLAMTVGLMQSNDFEYVVATVCASSMAVYSVRDIRNRSQFFFVTPGLILITYALVLTGFTLSRLGSFEVLYDKLLMVLLNALLVFFAFPLILLFEKLFGVTTDVTLLELSDTNRPLLKALMMHAPGTFHHSLQVANLSEAAADSIGANALLCRVGAYYHDIGKMENADYFVENQKGNNPHEEIGPVESARIIRDHVANGVKLAEEEGLPKVIIDFIRTHHGTSLIRFFYEKARETDPDIGETDFRYPGPLPITKETAIVLLADGIEAIARSLSDPTPAKLETVIHRYVDERIAEGQLSYSPLTFEDVLRIKQAFLSILAGMYHARVKYPGQDRLENNPQDAVSDSE